MNVTDFGKSFIPEFEKALPGLILNNKNFRVRTCKDDTFFRFDDDYEKFGDDGFYVLGVSAPPGEDISLYNNELILYHCIPTDDTEHFSFDDCEIVIDLGKRKVTVEEKITKKQPVRSSSITAKIIQKDPVVPTVLPGDEISYGMLTARDIICKELLVAESSKPWLNEIIKTAIKTKLLTT